MKKTYIAPKAQMIELETESLIADSLGTYDVVGNASALEGRNRVILWGDDDEE